MSDNNIFPDLDSFNNGSIPSLPLINPSMHVIETNRVLPGFLSVTCFQNKLGPPPIEGDEEDSILVNMNQEKQKNQILDSIVRKRKDGCTCKKTSCLKMYCDCFSKGRPCTQACSCTQCCNDEGHMLLVEQARNEIKSKGSRGKNSGGCTCKKTHCLKKYCECFSSGEKCGSSCKCLNCSNKNQSENDRKDENEDEKREEM